MKSLILCYILNRLNIQKLLKAKIQHYKMSLFSFARSFRYKTNYLYKFWKEKGFRATYNFFIARLYWATGFFPNLLLKRLAPLHIPYPRLIEVEPTTRCNLRCIMCEHTYWKEPSKDMTFEEFKHIVDQFPGLKWICVTGIGESFVNKDFMKMLRYVKSKKIYVEIFDNFYFMNENIIRELLDIGVDRILPSIESCTKKTYEKIRVGSNFEKVVKNLKFLINEKKRRKQIFPEMDYHYILTKLNIQEVPAFVDFVHSLDPDIKKISFTHVLHSFKEVRHLLLDEIPQKVIDEAEKRAKKHGITIGWHANIKEERLRPPIEDCTFWIIPFIFATGHVNICCAGNEANKREFQKRVSFGNILKKPFREIWNSKEYKKAIKMIRQGKCPIQCSTCTTFNRYPHLNKK